MPKVAKEIPRTITFTLDNEDVHEVIVGWENDGASQGKAPTQQAGGLRTLEHSPSDMIDN